MQRYSIKSIFYNKLYWLVTSWKPVKQYQLIFYRQRCSGIVFASLCWCVYYYIVKTIVLSRLLYLLESKDLTHVFDAAEYFVSLGKLHGLSVFFVPPPSPMSIHSHIDIVTFLIFPDGYRWWPCNVQLLDGVQLLLRRRPFINEGIIPRLLSRLRTDGANSRNLILAIGLSSQCPFERWLI